MPATILQSLWKIIFKYLTVFVITVGFFITILLVQATLLALISRFIYPLVIVALLVSLVLSIVFFLKIKKDSVFLPRITLLPLFLTALVVLLLVFFPHDTFGGRDEAGYANSAAYTAEHGTLKFPSYLNNLSNNYVEHIQSTLPVYTSWLALNKLVFGTPWMLRSNSVLIGLGFLAFFMVASLLGGSRIGLLASALYISSMPFLWFSRETMTENLSFFLLWFMLLIFFTFMKTKRLIYIVTLAIGGWLFALTRIEGLVIQLILFAILFFVMFKNRLLPYRYAVFTGFLYLLTLSSAVFVMTRLSLALYVLPTVNDVQNNITNFVRLGSITSLPKSSLYRNISIFTLSMLQKYNYGLVMFSILITAIYIILRRKRFVETTARYITILLVLSPEFLKLVNPGVTLDQPWLYRRFMYAILPFGYISLAILLDQLILKRKKRVSAVVFASLLIINIYLSKDILFLKNNWFLTDTLKSIGNNLTHDDLLIIKSWTLGYYYPASYFILQRGVRSFITYSLSDPKLMPKEQTYGGIPYKKLYFLSTSPNESAPGFQLTRKASISVVYRQLEPSCQLYQLGKELKLFDIYNYSMISYIKAVKFCAQPKNDIAVHDEQLILYELTYIF